MQKIFNIGGFDATITEVGFQEPGQKNHACRKFVLDEPVSITSDQCLQLTIDDSGSIESAAVIQK